MLKVRRSRWYNLLDKEDRVEAMRGVWGVIGWLMRAEGGGGEKGDGGKGDGGVEKEKKRDLTEGGKYRF